MANQNIPFDVTPTDTTPKIDPYPNTPNVPNDADALSRAVKYHYTMDKDSPGLEAVYHQIISGNENNLRDSQAMQQATKDKDFQNQMLNQYIQGHTGPVTDQTLENFRTLTAPKVPDAKVDMEKVFSEKMLNDLYFTPTKDDLVQMAHKENPEETSQLYNVFRDNIAKQEVVRKTLEDSQANWKQQSWVIGNKYGNSKLDDILETMIPFKSWADIAGQTDSGKLFLGADLADTVREGYMKPTSEFAPWFKSTYDAINRLNPLDAQHFAEAFVSYGSSDEWLDTGGNVLDIASIAPALGAVKAVKGAFKGTSLALSKLKEFDIPSLLSSAGHTEEAAKARVTRDFESNFKSYVGDLNNITENDKTGEIKKLIEGSPTYSDPLAFTRGGSIREVPNPEPKAGNIGTIPQINVDKPTDTTVYKAIKLNGKIFTDPEIQHANRANPDKMFHADIFPKIYADKREELVAKGYPDSPQTTLDAKNQVDDALDQMHGKNGGSFGYVVNGKYFEDTADAVEEAKRLRALPPKEITKEVPKEVVPTPTKLDGAFTARVNERVMKHASEQLGALSDNNRIERLGSAATQSAIDTSLEQAKREFSHIGDSVVELHEVMLPENNAANIGQTAFYLKQPNALPFQTAERADRYASTIYKLPAKSYSIENQGNDWYIKVVRPWDETHPNIRDQLIETGNVTPRKYWGLLRSNEDILPIDMRTGGKTGVHGIQDQYKLINQITQPIRDLGKQSKRDFIRFTEALREVDPTTNARGRLFNTMREFETAWQGMFNKLPTVKEVLAYHGYLKAYEWNHITRNLGVYRSLTRQGILDFSLAKADGTATNAFKGRFVDHVDLHRNDGFIVHDAGQAPVFFRGDKLLPPERKLIQASIDSGEYKIIQVAAPQTMPLKADLQVNDLVEFVLTKDFKADRINPIQNPFRPVHVEYQEPFNISQPRAMHAGGRYLYTHDTNVRKVNISADAVEQAGHYNEAQRLYRLRDPTFDTYVAQHLPHPGAQRLREAFDQGHLSTTEPFVVTRRGESAWDNNAVKNHYAGTGIEAYHQNPNNLYQTVDREHSGSLNIDPVTGNGIGNAENPLFPLSQPKFIDPLATINRSSAAAARNLFLEDYRFMAAEHFAQEFAPILKLSDDSLRNNPLSAIFRNDIFNENADRDSVMAAKNYQQAFKNFLHIRSDWDRNRGWMKEKMYEWVADHVGEARADAISNSKLLGTLSDPVHFVRSVAFSEHLALFNPAQYFKQLQTMTQIAGIAGPVIAGKAVPVSYLMRALMMNIADRPGMIDHFAGMASKFGWDTEHFKEAYLAMRKTGLDIVEGEHAFKDDMSDVKLFQGKVGQWIDKSAIFFREGERQTRIAAFNAAYLQWRQANPLAELDRRALQYILTRQDLMNGNMTRASNAAWQSMGRGVLNIPLQFATYPIRIMEQFVSSRLTTTEKARLFLTYSTMYGIPVAAGITPLGVYPFYQELQQKLLEHGITDDSNMIVETLHKGIIETMLHAIGGKQYNAGESLGVGGLQITKDMFNGQFMDVALGASGSTMGGIIKSIFPIYHDLATIFHEGYDEGKGTLIAQDFIDGMRNISSVNAAVKMIYALNYSKYISRGGTYVDDLNPFDAVLSAGFGISPQSQDDISREIQSDTDLKAAQDGAEKEMIKYIQRGLDTDLNDTKTREAFFRQAEVWRVLGDIPMTQFSSILERAVKGKESLAKSLNFNFFLKKAPESQMKQRQDAIINEQKKVAPVLGIRG